MTRDPEKYVHLDLELDEETTLVANMFIHEGELRERERIIALLEAQDYAGGKAAHKENPSGVCRICRAIALIKGENK